MMQPIERRRFRWHKITGWACAIDALALLSASGYCSAGQLPVWLYAPIAAVLLLCGMILYRVTAQLYVDYRRQQIRQARNDRLAKIREERELNGHK